jgi:hypothetical protein
MAGEKLRGVHTFAAGDHPGDAEGEVWTYTPGDLAEIARNFALLSRGPRPLHRVPVVVTHDGAEAYGWVRAARAAGADFLTDWEDVNPGLKAAIDARKFDSVSAEIRKDFKGPDGRTIPGQYLYRVSVQGAQVPRVKGLAPLSAAKWFGEKGGGRKLTGVRRMADTGTTTAPGTAAEALQQELLGEGISQELLDSLDEPQLVLLFRDVKGEEAGEPDPVKPGGGADMADPATMTREELIAELVAAGHDEAALQGKTDDELRALLTETRAQKPGGGTRTMSDGVKPASGTGSAGNPGANSTSAPGPASDLERKFAELQATVRRLEGQAAAVTATQKAALAQEQARLREATKGRVYDACAQARRENRLEAWELDESDPQTLSYPQQLLLLDAVNPVTRKFADASGKEVTVSRTPLDDALEALKKRPVRKFSELAVRGQARDDDPEAEAAKAAKEWAEKRNRQTAGKG